MIRCKKCGKIIGSVNVGRFNYDGSDSDIKYSLNEVEEDAVYFETDANWTGYELSEEEMSETIYCPHCDEFPFNDKEVQVYNIVRVVCFKGGDTE